MKGQRNRDGEAEVLEQRWEHAGLSESFEVDSCVVKASGQSRDILLKKNNL